MKLFIIAFRAACIFIGCFLLITGVAIVIYGFAGIEFAFRETATSDIIINPPGSSFVAWVKGGSCGMMDREETVKIGRIIDDIREIAAVTNVFASEVIFVNARRDYHSAGVLLIDPDSHAVVFPTIKIDGPIAADHAPGGFALSIQSTETLTRFFDRPIMPPERVFVCGRSRSISSMKEAMIGAFIGVTSYSGKSLDLLFPEIILTDNESGFARSREESPVLSDCGEFPDARTRIAQESALIRTRPFDDEFFFTLLNENTQPEVANTGEDVPRPGSHFIFVRLHDSGEAGRVCRTLNTRFAQASLAATAHPWNSEAGQYFASISVLVTVLLIFAIVLIAGSTVLFLLWHFRSLHHRKSETVKPDTRSESLPERDGALTIPKAMLADPAIAIAGTITAIASVFVLADTTFDRINHGIDVFRFVAAGMENALTHAGVFIVSSIIAISLIIIDFSIVTRRSVSK